jgi:4,5-DOPA dioxygenase extradiol
MTLPSIMAMSMPVTFIAHAAPPLLEDSKWKSELAKWAEQMPHPKALLVLSAHWLEDKVSIGSVQPRPLIYDYYGYPDHYYKLQYPAPGAPELAQSVRDLLAKAGLPFKEKPKRGLDHGVYIPLMVMYPKADVPLLQISLPKLDPLVLYRMGQALAPLSQQGVLICASGMLTHNMQADFDSGVPLWAKEIDSWLETALQEGRIDDLLDSRHKAPHFATAHPSWEHFAPIMVSLGAAGSSAKVTFPIMGFWNNSGFNRRSVQWQQDQAATKQELE